MDFFNSLLVETILDDVGGEPGGLPLLEFLLGELWKERSAGHLLTHGAYAALGRVAGAIAHRAETVFTQLLNDTERTEAHRLLIRMVRPGEGVEDTRRRAAVPLDHPVAEATIRKLAGERLVVTERDAGTGDVVAEVAHEALIHRWQRLREWIDDDREFLRTRERIAGQAQLWENEDRSPDRLLPPGRSLAEGEDLLAKRYDDLESQLREFIQASVQSARRSLNKRVHRLRATVAVLALLTIGSSIAGVYAYTQKTAAQQERKRITLGLSNAIAGFYQGRDAEAYSAQVDGLGADQSFTQKYGYTIADLDLSVFVNSMAVAFRFAEQEKTDRTLEYFQKAIDAANRMLAANPKDPLPSFGIALAAASLGEIYFRKNDTDRMLNYAQQALAAVERGIDLDPANVLGQFFRTKMLQSVAQARLDAGDEKGAREIYNKALEAQSRVVKNLPHLIGPQADLADLWEAVGDFRSKISDKDGAIEAHKNALEIRQKLLDETPNSDAFKLQVAQSLNDIGSTNIANSPNALTNYEQALRLLREVTRSQSNNKKARKQLANTLRMVGTISAVQSGSQSDAEPYYAEAVALYEDRLKLVFDDRELSSRTAAGIFLLINTMKARGRMGNSGEFDRAFTLMAGKAIDPQGALQEAWQALAQVRLKDDRPDEAFASFENARLLGEMLRDARPGERKWQMAIQSAVMGQAAVRVLQRNYTVAIRMYEQVVDTFNGLLTQHPEDDDLKWELGLAWEGFGAAQEVKGDVNAAIEAYKTSFGIRQGIISSISVDRAKLLADFLDKIGTISANQHNFMDMEKYYKISLSIRQNMVNEHSEDPARRLDLLRGWNTLARVRAQQGNHRGSIEAYQECTNIISHRENDGTLDTDWSSLLAINYYGIAEQYIKMNKMDIAYTYLYKSLSIRRKLSNLNPDDLTQRDSVASLLSAIAVTEDKLGNLAAGISSKREVLNIREEIAKKDPTNVHQQQALADALNELAWALLSVNHSEFRNDNEAMTLAKRAAEISDAQNPVILDTLAMAYFAQGDLERAISTLEKARSLIAPQPAPDLVPVANEIDNHLRKFRAAQKVHAGSSANPAKQ